MKVKSKKERVGTVSMDNYTKDYELCVAVLEMRAQQAQLEAQIAWVELQQMQIRDTLSSEAPVVHSDKRNGKRRGRPPGSGNAQGTGKGTGKVGRRPLSAAARKRIAAAQKKRWAEYRAKRTAAVIK